FKLNLERAGIDNNDIDSIFKRLKPILINFVPTVIHRDLSVGNIMVNEAGKVKLIDPRPSLPQLAEKESQYIFGSVVFDLVGYKTSLFRKYLEKARNNDAAYLLRPIVLIDKVIEGYQRKGYFSEEMKDLSSVYWNSVYAACKCDYCLAENRRWLYEIMTN